MRLSWLAVHGSLPSLVRQPASERGPRLHSEPLDPAGGHRKGGAQGSLRGPPVHRRRGRGGAA